MKRRYFLVAAAAAIGLMPVTSAVAGKTTTVSSIRLSGSTDAARVAQPALGTMVTFDSTYAKTVSTPRIEVDLRHAHLDFLVEDEPLTRMVSPRLREDVRDVEQPEDPGLELDEHAVFLHAGNTAPHERAHLVLRRGVQPQIVGQLLQANGNAPRALIHLEHLDAQLLVQRHDLRRMSHVLPRHLRDVQQRVDAAHI